MPATTYDFGHALVTAEIAHLVFWAIVPILVLVLLILVSKNENINEKAKLPAYSYEDAKKKSLKNKVYDVREPIQNFLAPLSPNPENGKTLRLGTMLIMWAAAFVSIYFVSKLSNSMRQKMWDGVPGGVALTVLVSIVPSMIVALLYCLTVRFNLGTLVDMLVLFVLGIIACYKFVCAVNRCCYGIDWEGFLSIPRYEKNVFAIQIPEGISYLAILAFGIWFMCKSKHYIAGRGCAVTASLFLGARFFWEFLRADEKSGDNDGFFGLRAFQVVAILIISMMVAFWYIIPHLPKWQVWAEEKIFMRKKRASKEKKKGNGNNAGNNILGKH